MTKLILTIWGVLFLTLPVNNPFIETISPFTESAGTINENLWIRNKIDSTMKANNIPAVSYGIIRNGKLSYSGGIGVMSRKNKIIVNENTIYQIGSDTKKFTGIIVNNLISEGMLTLRKPITGYLPELNSGARQRLQNITLEHLLLHKSGIPNRAPSDPRIDGDPMIIEYSTENLMKDLNDIQPEFAPGSKFSYSNLGYAVIGYICEKVSGIEFSGLVEKYITQKYKLKNTFIYPGKEHLPYIATPYRKDDRTVETKPFRMGKLAPAGGVYSNVVDLSKLMIKQMEAYRLFLKDKKSGSPLILTNRDSVSNSHYGFGLAQSAGKAGIHYGHGGDLDGFASGYVFMPEKKTGLILLTSSGGRWFGKMEKDIFEKLVNNVY
jgi:CubicO group peptidase (beta-lactamase class C family)